MLILCAVRGGTAGVTGDHCAGGVGRAAAAGGPDGDQPVGDAAVGGIAPLAARGDAAMAPPNRPARPRNTAVHPGAGAGATLSAATPAAGPRRRPASPPVPGGTVTAATAASGRLALVRVCETHRPT